MKKYPILFILLFNFAAALLILELVNPAWLSSIYYRGSLNQSQFSIPVLVFLVQSTFAIWAYMRAFKARNIFTNPFVIILSVLGVGGLMLAMFGQNCSGDACAVPFAIGVIAVLIFYVIFQIFIASMISKAVQTNHYIIVNTMITAMSIVLFVIVGYGVTTCGLFGISRDACYADAAIVLIRADLCDNIMSTSKKERCLSDVSFQEDVKRKTENPQVIFEEGIPRCHAIAFNTWTYPDHRGPTAKERCYDNVVSDADQFLFTNFSYPCTAKSIITAQEEDHLIACLKEFSTSKNAEEYRQSCKHLAGIQQERCQTYSH